MTVAAVLQSARLLRFLFVGGAGFLVNEAALWLALAVLRLSPYLGGLFSFLIAATFTWWGNRRLTFREHAATGAYSLATEWLSFIAVNGIGFAVNYALYAALIAFAPRPMNNPFVALALGTIAGLGFNYVLSSRLVFRAGRTRPGEVER